MNQMNFSSVSARQPALARKFFEEKTGEQNTRRTTRHKDKILMYFQKVMNINYNHYVLEIVNLIL